MASPSNRPFTSLGEIPGFCARTRAAAPAVTAEAKDVPDPTKLAAPTMAPGLVRAMVEPGSSKLMTERPGATRSGLSQPSYSVGPTDENEHMPHWDGLGDPLSAYAPTLMASGSSAGLVIVPLKGPELPAATTTVMPADQADSTA